jgi:hypothetical protein
MNSQKIKIGIFLIVIAILGVGAWCVLQKNDGRLPLTGGLQENQQIPPTDSSDGNDIGENSTTTAVFVGYYTTRNVIGVDGNEPETCSAFIVFKDDDPLFVYFSDMVKQGNTVNALDSKGNLILNVDLNAVSTATKEKLITSTSVVPITLNVQKRILHGKGASACASFVNILSIQ